MVPDHCFQKRINPVLAGHGIIISAFLVYWRCFCQHMKIVVAMVKEIVKMLQTLTYGS